MKIIKVLFGLGITLWLVFATLNIFGLKKTNTYNEKKVQISEINRICQLCTCRAYYHNVADFEKDREWWNKHGLREIGNKRIWIEYDTAVDYLIDINQVSISEPDENNVIEVHVPNAEVEVLDAYNFYDVIYEKGLFTTITTEDKTETYAEAQEQLKSEAQENETLMMKTQNNAKELIEEYIVNVGKQINEDYKVKFI